MQKIITAITVIGLLLITSTAYTEEFKINFDKCHYIKLVDKLKTKKAKSFSIKCSKDDKSVKCMIPEYGEIEYPIVFETNSSLTFAYNGTEDSEAILLNKKTKEAKSQWILISSDYIGGLSCTGTFKMIKKDKKEK